MASIASKVQADIDAMVTEHPMGEALAATALRLAERLDGTIEDKSMAGVARELRAILVELAKFAAGGVDELEEELSTPFDAEDP